MNQNHIRIIKRYTISLIGLASMALAVALMAKTALGISPIQSICYVIYRGFPQYLSLGTLIFCWNCTLLLLQIIILGKKFHLINLVQLPLSLFFGWAVDLWGQAFAWFSLSYIVWRILLMFCAVVILAFGISVMLAPQTVMNPGEAFVSAVSEKSGISFARIKVLTDTSIITLSILLSFILFGMWKFDIIGIGTLTSGLSVGFMIGFFNKRVQPFINQICSK